MLTLATLLSLLDGFDDTDSNGLPHVTDGETTERGILVVGLYTHGLTRNELGNAGITGLDELRRVLEGLAASPVDFLDQLGELTGNVGSVTIQHRGVALTDLTGVVEDDDLGVERSGLLGGVVLRVRGDVSTADILNRYVLDVETNVVTRLTGLELLVVHLNRLDFSGHVRRGKGNDHASFDNASLDTANGHSSDTTNLVNILKRETEGLVGRTGGRFDGVDGIQKGPTLDGAGLGISDPALVPRHAGVDRLVRLITLVESAKNSLGGLLQHIISVPSRDGDEGNGLGVVTNLFDEVGGFLDDFVETLLAPLCVE